MFGSPACESLPLAPGNPCLLLQMPYHPNAPRQAIRLCSGNKLTCACSADFWLCLCRNRPKETASKFYIVLSNLRQRASVALPVLELNMCCAFALQMLNVAGSRHRLHPCIKTEKCGLMQLHVHMGACRCTAGCPCSAACGNRR